MAEVNANGRKPPERKVDISGERKWTNVGPSSLRKEESVGQSSLRKEETQREVSSSEKPPMVPREAGSKERQCQ